MKKIVLMSMLSCISVSSFAAIKENVDYMKLPKPVPVAGPNVEVAEFFSYHCVHCMHFEPFISKWSEKLPAGVTFKKEQVVWQESMSPLAKLHYTFNALKVPQNIKAKAYDTMVNKRINLAEPSKAKEFLMKEVKNPEALKVFDSFGSNAYVAQAKKMTLQYNVQGTPAIVVDGKYLVQTQEDWNKVIGVINELVAKSKAERLAKK